MTSTLRLAWRNIWRNKRRTLLTMSAIGIGLMLVLIYSSMIGRMLGEAQQELDNVGLGHVELNAPGWRAQRATTLVVDKPQRVIEGLRSAGALPESAEVGARVLVRGLLTSARGNEPVEVHGVDWAAEARLSDYLRQIVAGEVPADDVAGIVIGDKLAERMKLEVGDKVRLMVQRADGEMSAELFRVRGVYHALSSQISQRRVLIGQPRAQEMLGIGDAAHQIVVQLDRSAAAQEVAKTARAALGSGIEVLTYAEIYPVFQSMEAMTNSVVFAMSIFVYFLVGLGILNTILMSVLERTREFGVMQALGTRPGGVVGLVLAESFWIATVAVLVGVALGTLVNIAGSEAPLVDYSEKIGEGVELGGTVVRLAMRTQVSLGDTIIATAYVYIMALAVGIYPALRAARMRPVDALQSK
jgi:ABC-type lipoprotein release transport system permease subunit